MVEELGRYKILEEIGRGGFAIVYRGHDTELNRQVALKELRPTLLHDTEYRSPRSSPHCYDIRCR
jgi:serine/threonine-protein kinase